MPTHGASYFLVVETCTDGHSHYCSTSGTRGMSHHRCTSLHRGQVLSLEGTCQAALEQKRHVRVLFSQPTFSDLPPPPPAHPNLCCHNFWLLSCCICRAGFRGCERRLTRHQGESGPPLCARPSNPLPIPTRLLPEVPSPGPTRRGMAWLLLGGSGWRL